MFIKRLAATAAAAILASAGPIGITATPAYAATSTECQLGTFLLAGYLFNGRGCEPVSDDGGPYTFFVKEVWLVASDGSNLDHRINAFVICEQAVLSTGSGIDCTV